MGTLPETRLDLSRQQILAWRRRAGTLDRRLGAGARSIQKAAWCGLQDSMPRAALLSLHARIEGVKPNALDDPAIVQLWGPRYSVYAVAAGDHAIFSLGRMPGAGAKRRLAEDLAARLATVLDGREMPLGEAARALGENHNRLRYATLTGRILIRWDGARAPRIRSLPAPDVAADSARRELARRYLHVFGPTTAQAFARWAGIGRRAGLATFDALRSELAPVRTPLGDAWILAQDEPAVRAQPGPPAPARLLPSGDAFYLLQGRDRELLVAEATRRDALWTSRVWPGALLVAGDVAGTWRRNQHILTVQPWRRLSRGARTAVEAEAASLPLPGVEREIAVIWQG